MKKLMDSIDEIPILKKLFNGDRDMMIKAVAAVLIIIIALAWFMIRSTAGEEVEAEEDIKSAENETESVMIFVDVGGEVNSPKVAELEEGSRVEDAIEAAGGLTANADITDINRAAFINDGDKIFIPSVQSAEAIDEEGSASGYYSDGKININTADSAQLQELTGIGPATAEKIINYRKDHGRFASIDEIKNVSGIGDKTYEKFKDNIKV